MNCGRCGDEACKEGMKCLSCGAEYRRKRFLLFSTVLLSLIISVGFLANWSGYVPVVFWIALQLPLTALMYRASRKSWRVRPVS